MCLSFPFHGWAPTHSWLWRGRGQRRPRPRARLPAASARRTPAPGRFPHTNGRTRRAYGSHRAACQASPSQLAAGGCLGAQRPSPAFPSPLISDPQTCGVPPSQAGLKRLETAERRGPPALLGEPPTPSPLGGATCPGPQISATNFLPADPSMCPSLRRLGPRRPPFTPHTWRRAPCTRAPGRLEPGIGSGGAPCFLPPHPKPLSQGSTWMPHCLESGFLGAPLPAWGSKRPHTLAPRTHSCSSPLLQHPGVPAPSAEPPGVPSRGTRPPSYLFEAQARGRPGGAGGRAIDPGRRAALGVSRPADLETEDSAGAWPGAPPTETPPLLAP